MIEDDKLVFNKEIHNVIDPNKIIAILLKRWYIIASTILISLLFTYISLRYTKPLYTASITMKLDDEKPTQVSDLFRFGRSTGKFDNFLKTEGEIIKSKAYAEKALAGLDYEYSFQQKGKIVTTETYPFENFKIKTLVLDSTNPDFTFTIRFINGVDFELRYAGNKIEHYKFYDSIRINNHVITVLPLPTTPDGYATQDPVICSRISNASRAAGFAGALGVEVVKGTSLVMLQMTSEVPKLASDYLNAFSSMYTRVNVENKSLAAQQTLDFIDLQLMELAEKVKKSEFELSNMKAQNRGLELDKTGDVQFEKLTEFESKKNILSLRYDMVLKLQKSLQGADDAPLSFVIFDNEDAEGLPNLLQKYNDLVLERLTLLQKNTSSSPLMKESELQLREIKKVLTKTLKGYADKINVKIQYNNAKIKEVEQVLNSMPMKQQMLIGIQRNFKVNEKVYSFLLEKKLETSISKASITSNAMVIEPSETPSAPVYPDKGRSYTIALMIGLASGLLIIVISRLVYQKIPDKETIEQISSIPVIGVVKKINNVQNDYEIHTFSNPKSIFSESIRGIRTAISFIVKGQDQRIICVTSTVSGEGKTFCTINLAASFTLLNKKVIIVGCDLRRPKVHHSFENVTNGVGLTNYLIGKSSIDEIIQTSGKPNLDVITAGPTPPNPSELLQTNEMRNLLIELRNRYDYVLIDSAPVGLVSDSLNIMEMSDINLYIIRANYSKRDFAQIPDRLKTDSSISNLYTILNSYDNESVIYSSIYKNDYGGYYSGGGYYYYGGYYGKGGYGYYGKRYNNSYYSGYYTNDEDDDEKSSFLKKMLAWIPKRSKKSPY